MEHIKALIAVQADIGPISTNAKNNFLNDYEYADINAVIEKVLPILGNHGFALIQSTNRDEHGDYLQTLLQHESGGFLESKTYLYFKKGDMQSYGGSITYARRYALTAFLGLRTGDDDGNKAVGIGKVKEKAQRQEKDPKKRLTKAQTDMLDRAGKLETFLETANADQLVQFGAEVHTLIADIFEFNEERSDELKQAFDSREAEVLKQ